MLRRVAAIATALALLPGCTQGDPGDGARGEKSPRGERPEAKRSDEKLKERKPTGPRRTRVINDATGPAGRLTRRAIADLKGMGFWDDLTKRIFAVRITSRTGTVPGDGHLADSLWTYYRDEQGELGDLCDVLMFTRAVKDDVARQEIYYAQGRLAYPAPSVGQFWAVLLAHELSHCTDRGQKGEAYSTRWEKRVLEGYGIDRIGTP
jgi:hypothetical protein